jgi:hypothetical protein
MKPPDCIDYSILIPENVMDIFGKKKKKEI